MEKKPRTERQTKVSLFYKLYLHFKKRITIADLSEGFGFNVRTGDAWLREARDSEKSDSAILRDNIKYLTSEELDGGEGEPSPKSDEDIPEGLEPIKSPI